MKLYTIGISGFAVLAIATIASAIFAIQSLGAGAGSLSGLGLIYKPSDTSTPSPTPTCPTIQDYLITQTAGATVVPGVADIGNHCDDCITVVTLPFPVSFYGAIFTSTLVGSNGTLGFAANGNSITNTCLPYTGATDFIAPYWDDQLTREAGDGVFSATIGSPPNRTFVLEWRSCVLNTGTGSCGAHLNYEVLLRENSSDIVFIYGEVAPPAPGAYTVGIQKGMGTKVAQWTCPPVANLSAGLQLLFVQQPCGAPTFTITPTRTRTYTPTRTFTPTRTSTRTPTITPGGITLTPTRTATPTPCVDYTIVTGTGMLLPGDTLVPGSQRNDSAPSIALPFPILFYGLPFTSINASTNGNIQFTGANTAYANVCLPNSLLDTALIPFWDDLDLTATVTNTFATGIYTGVSGTSPNRTFVVEWRGCLFSSPLHNSCPGGLVNFEAIFYENSQTISTFYASTNNGGAGATIGAQFDAGTRSVQVECDTGGLLNGERIDFVPVIPCGPSPTATNTPTQTRTPSATWTATPFPTCGPGSDYVIEPSEGGAIVPGVADIGNHCDDCVTTITLPFAYSLYGQPFNTVSASSNGNLQFSGAATAFTNTCLPAQTFGYAIFAHWDDLNTLAIGAGCSAFAGGCGIFTSVSGSAPNRVFNIEWRAYYRNNNAQVVNIEVRLFEGQDTFSVIYGRIDQSGASATTGVQRDAQSSRFRVQSSLWGGNAWGFGLSTFDSSASQYSCNQSVLNSGLQLHFRPLNCGEPTQTRTATATSTGTTTPTVTPGGPTLTPTNTNTATGTLTATFTRTATHTPAACGSSANYMIATATGTMISGATLVAGSQGDDIVVNIPLPFTYTLYGSTFTSVGASSNGNLQFTGADDQYINTCLPDANMNNLIAPHWDDLLTSAACGPNCGIYTSTVGTAPNRIFVVEWRACIFDSAQCAGNVNFETLLYEGQALFDVIYGVVTDNGGPHSTGDAGATIGVQRGTGPQVTEFSCNAATLSNGLRLIFQQPSCGGTGTPTFTPTLTPPGTMHGHLTWQGVAAANRPSVTGTLILCTNGTPTFYSFNTDTGGSFTVTTNLPDGSYNWMVKGGRHISNSSPADGAPITIAGGHADQEFGLQKGGNANADNITNATDFTTLKNQFGQSGPRQADFDYNNVVNASDFTVLKNNFGQAGHNITCP